MPGEGAAQVPATAPAVAKPGAYVPPAPKPATPAKPAAPVPAATSSVLPIVIGTAAGAGGLVLGLRMIGGVLGGPIGAILGGVVGYMIGKKV